MSSVHTIVIVVAVCMMVLIVYWQNILLPVRRAVIIGRIWGPSARCDSFHTWAQMLQRQAFLSCREITDHPIERPLESHFILCNHISSHYAIGSFITAAVAASPSPASIICYQSYTSMVFIYKTVHHILQKEICIDIKSNNAEKEAQMVAGIRQAFHHGRNVVMFIDAHTSTKPMRSLNRKVLGYFPMVQKQLVHILEPTGVSDFRFQRYPPTTSVEEIIMERERLLVGPTGSCSSS